MAFLRKNRCLLLIACAVLAIECLAHGAEDEATSPGLANLDRLATKAQNLEGFLASPELQSEYYEALQKYYGEGRVPRVSYDAVLGQLKELKEKVPGLASRLWETNNLGESFSINLPVQSSGLQLKTEAWKNHFTKTLSELDAKYPNLAKLSAEVQTVKLEEMVAKLSESIESFEAGQQALPRLQRQTRAKEFYSSLCAQTDACQEGRALLARRNIASERFMDPLLAGDADLAINAWRELRAGVDLSLNGKPISGAVKNVLLRGIYPELELPKLEVVRDPITGVIRAAENEFFTVKTKLNRQHQLVPEGATAASDLHLYTLPRRFHGIWKGIALGECVGGNCQSLSSLTPERWATIALNNSRLYHLEKDGSYHGFLQLVPVEVKGKVYGSIEFGAPMLGKKIAQSTKSGLRPQPLVNVVMRELEKRNPTQWAGMILGESDAINNAGVHGSVRSNYSYSLGRKLDPLSPANHLDPMAKEIVKNSPRQGHANHYAGNMIVDATLSGQKDLRVLRPNFDLKEFRRQRSAGYLVSLLGAKDQSRAGTALEAIEKLNLPIKYSAEEIASLATKLDSTTESNAEKVIQLLSKNGETDSPVAPKILADLIAELKKSNEELQGRRVKLYAQLLTKIGAPLPDAALDQLARTSLERDDLDLRNLLSQQKFIARGKLSAETRDLMAKQFIVKGPGAADNSHSLATALDINPPQDLTALKRFWSYLLQAIDNPSPSLWQAHSMALNFSQKYSSELAAEQKAFKEKALLKLRPLQYLAYPDSVPFLNSLEESDLAKLPREKLFTIATSFNKDRFRRTGKGLQEKIQELAANAATFNPVQAVQAFIDIYNNNEVDILAAQFRVTESQSAAARAFLTELSNLKQVRESPEAIESLFQFSITHPTPDGKIELLPSLLAGESRTYRLRDPKSLEALLKANMLYSQSSSRSNAERQKLLSNFTGSLSDEERALFVKEKQRYLGSPGTRIADYLGIFPADTSEPWFLDHALPDAISSKPFETFVWDLNNSAPTPPLAVSERAQKKLAAALLDPSFEKHADLAMGLLQRRAPWNADILEKYLQRLLDFPDQPTKQQIFQISSIFHLLNKNHPNVNSPLWQKIRKLEIAKLIESTFPKSGISVSAEEKTAILRKAFQRADRPVLNLLKYMQADDAESGQSASIWKAVLKKEPASIWSCAGFFGRLKGKRN